ncbi:hypothetical protein HN51_052159, partial [Arachis hypogaea]
MLFLMSLNENLASVRNQILLLDLLPPIEKVFSLVLQRRTTQYNQLMTLLQTQQALQDIELEICASEVFSSCYSNQKAYASSWIVDSRATTHITNSFKFLENPKPLTNHFVALPDYTKIRALAIGNVVLNSFLILYNVIFIPSFRDRSSKKVIGRGDETDDLFLLQSPFT